MRTYVKFKNSQWWVWSSKTASLDCLPQAKFDFKDLADEYSIGFISPVLKKKIQDRKQLLRKWAEGFNK